LPQAATAEQSGRKDQIREKLKGENLVKTEGGIIQKKKKKKGTEWVKRTERGGETVRRSYGNASQGTEGGEDAEEIVTG